MDFLDSLPLGDEGGKYPPRHPHHPCSLVALKFKGPKGRGGNELALVGELGKKVDSAPFLGHTSRQAPVAAEAEAPLIFYQERPSPLLPFSSFPGSESLLALSIRIPPPPLFGRCRPRVPTPRGEGGGETGRPPANLFLAATPAALDRKRPRRPRAGKRREGGGATAIRGARARRKGEEEEGSALWHDDVGKREEFLVLWRSRLALPRS